MKRKLIAALLCVVVSLSLFTMNAFAVGTGDPELVEYLDESGGKPKLASYNVIDSNTTEWTDGWYIADGTITISSRVKVSGNVNLVLIDGCSLKVEGGIYVPGGANTLTIYAQSTDGAGTLITTNVFWSSAAIGGNLNEGNGSITINGGNIICSESGSGIGTGYDPNGQVSGEVIINGGNIDSKRINGSNGGSVLISPPVGYAMAVRTGDNGRVEGSPFVSETNINEIIKNANSVYIRQVPNSFHSITVETNGNGTATAEPVSTVKEDAVQLTVVPDSYYRFKEWQSDEVTVSENNTFIMPDKDVTVKAIFEHNPDIPYLDENGELTYITEERITRFTPDMSQLSEGWYLIEGTNTLENRLEVSGNVHMILADGCSLTAKKGIRVGQGNGYCNNLTIYAQSTEKPGAITATTGGSDAAIGGNNQESSGQITINGGIIKATIIRGTEVLNGAAGIGGGGRCGRGYVTINNGDITAESWYGAAIGGSATADNASATLPEGRGYITINGGTINATAHLYGAGIGGGERTGSEVTINGGNIIATGHDDAVAIGGAYEKRGFYSRIKITGGHIRVMSERGEVFGIGSGGSLIADLEDGYAIDTKVVGKADVEVQGSPFLSGDLYEIIKPWKNLYLNVEPYHSIRFIIQGEGQLTRTDHTIAVKGTRVGFWVYPEEHSHRVNCTSEEVQFEDYGSLLRFTMPEKDVTVTVTFEHDLISYLDAEGNEQTTKDYTVVKEDTTKLEDGWYAVWDTKQIPKRIETTGDVHLILMDDCNLEAQDGIHVGPDSNLTIYAQSTGEKAGKITVDLKSTGSEKTWQCAAIGGNYEEDSGQITINGGNITAVVNNGPAGIGGGALGVGRVTVNNGEVTATSRYGAGIGGGILSKIRSIVIINGGNVSGESTNGGAGIGGGNQGNAKVTINGGVVIGKGDGNGSGIGGGNKGEGFILVTGGITDGISETGEGMMAGKTGKITVSPKEGSSLEVKIKNVAIEGSPFTEEKDIEEKLKGKNEVHIEAFYESGGAGDTPSTGDRYDALSWILLMIGAGLIFAGCMVYYRKKKAIK